MKKISLEITVFFILMMPFCTKAQIGRFYSTDKELSNSLINQVYQDKKGFIWIATENGLNRFDGTRFSIYKHNSADSTSIKNNYVRTLYEDNLGRFWIGCINGLQIYDRATDSFKEIFIHRKDGRINPHITSIVERSNGDVWITTSGQGVISLKKGKPLQDFHTESELTQKMHSNFLNVIFEDSKHNLWIATEDKGLFRYFPENGQLKQYKAPYDLLSDDVYAICEDRKGNIFVGTLTGGLFKLPAKNKKDDEEPKFQPVIYKKNILLSIRTLMIDKQGRLFIGSDGEGLKEYNADKNIIEDSEINAAPFDFSKSKIHSLIEDKDNNLWLGIFQKGIILIPGTPNKFGYYGYKSIRKNTIGSSCVMAICTDETGTTWVGTDNDGLYTINDEGEQLAHYSQQPGNPHSVPGTIMCIYEDSNNDLWIGSYFNGLAKVNKKTGQCEYITSLSHSNNGSSGNEKVLCITEDDHKNLWIGTSGSGVYKMSLKNRKVIHYESTRSENDDWNIDKLPNDWINCIVKDRSGMLWIGTYKGLSCFNPDKNTFINYKNKNNLLPGYVVYTILEASDGRIWAGTSEGLACFDRKRSTITRFTTANGLPSDVICGLAEDERDNIWISTHQGISKLIVKKNKYINYYACDGIQGNEFTRGAIYKDKRGKVYFGGTNGITTFFPKEITEQKKELKVVITELYLANHAVRKGDKSGGNVITDTLVMDANSFTLAHNENTFSIEFSVLEFNNPERISYQYKIDELGNEWISNHPGVNRVTFSNLNPGKYTFRVRACDHDNYSNIRTVTFIITPPWYQSWWAICIWSMLIIIMIYAITMYILSRIRHKQELLRREHLEQISEAKLQFFINISHEIRTPMTLIISPLEKLLTEHSEKQGTYLMMYRNAQRILRLINQLMDIRKLDKGQMHLKFRETDIIGFIDDLMQTFDYQAQKKNISFTFTSEINKNGSHASSSQATDLSRKEELKVWVDLNNFDKVLLNVLSNAFKYTPEGGSISVKLTTGQDENIRGPLRNYFEISVSDTGIGIDKNKIEQIFERFYQINNDLTKSNFGTGIGLHLSRSLVELHHGTINAENRKEGSGTRFIIRLPLGFSHLKADELEYPSEASNSESTPSTLTLEKETVQLREEEEEENKKIKAKTHYRILIVEDEDEIRHYIRDELSEDYHIAECVNGYEALEYILKEKPDMIISDVMMPEMDGIALCRKVKQNINVNHIPIILLTAKSKTEDRLEGLEIGADAYIVKPFNTELLRITISNLINNRERLKSKYSGEKQIEEKMAKIEMKSADEILMGKIMRTINEHLSDATLNVELLAANAGMSRVHMHRKLKELTNQSARDFIRGIRLKQAATLFKEKDLTISEVAYATGFSNLSHFSNSFKEFYGMSPTEYKEQTFHHMGEAGRQSHEAETT
ncbi:two-component regulator propeller domain-containing protein [uncultured Bacteroides sp.]|uniref:hybrid sensor histidine kinase/response regulator transcription factor n=1 Tax=uncultured Bacteroides sp. TaxID=162156 RepID=UPI002AA8718D|nr:two-component regulator propeller domain-containing protein [uncultured Bacteroides sp.]